MKKIVTTEMSEKCIWITVAVMDSEGNQVSFFQYEFPFDMVNPQTTLRIATFLVSDPTLPVSKPCNCPPNEPSEDK